jgi:uncharacterized membrane protein
MAVNEEGRARKIGRVTLAAIFGAAGIIHLARPAPFIAITPDWVPDPPLVIAATGVAELLGTVGLLQPFSPGLRRWAGGGLALYALCVWPANVHHMQIDMARPGHGPGHGLGLGYHIPRLLAQPLIMAWALWAGGIRLRRRNAG